MTTTSQSHVVPRRWALVLTLYLLGIFMGALDTGIITPARTVIQNNMGVGEQTGIWMITIYTLAYAAAIPVMGKLADRFGRKPLYLIAIALFGIGSLACGLSQDFESFPMLLAARVVQAIGGGGIIPIATAEVGSSVPPERRGMALGLVGGVYGIANVFGASAGSLILDIVGTNNWQWIFYINVPIAIAIIVIGLRVLPTVPHHQNKPIDVAGITVLVVLITCLLWGIQHLDFFDLGASVTDPNVYGFLGAALLLVPVLIFFEIRAKDPAVNLRYFSTQEVGITLLLGFLSGMVMMAIVFVPQFAENSMRLATGAGGYPVIIIGLASGVGAPLSGRLTDRYGPRAILGLGGLISVLAAVVLILWAVPNPGTLPTIVALILMGLGLGFLVGSPLNYLMMHLVPASQATSALATLSLVRAIGTTLAPAILVGLLATSLTGLSITLMDQMPKQVTIGQLPHAVELQQRFDEFKKDPAMADKMAGLDIPDLTQTTFDIDMGQGGGLPADLQLRMRTADVTTIVERSVEVANYMFDQQTPTRVSQIQDGVAKGMAALNDADAQLAAAEQQAAQHGAPTAGMAAARAELATTIQQMTELSDAVPAAFEQGRTNYVNELRANGRALEDTFQLEMNRGFGNVFWFYGLSAVAMLLLLFGVPRRPTQVVSEHSALRGMMEP